MSMNGHSLVDERISHLQRVVDLETKVEHLAEQEARHYREIEQLTQIAAAARFEARAARVRAEAAEAELDRLRFALAGDVAIAAHSLQRIASAAMPEPREGTHG